MTTENACYRCRRPPGSGKRECRPYGPGGALLCAGCMFGEGDTPPEPSVQAEASRQFGVLLNRADEAAGPGGIVILDRTMVDAAPAPCGVRQVKE